MNTSQLHPATRDSHTDDSRYTFLKFLLINSAVALVYFCTARLALLFSFEHTNASPFWPPAGVALAALLLIGPRVIPGILIGAFTANSLTFISHDEVHAWSIIWKSAAISLGNMLGCIVAWCCIGRNIPSHAYFLSNRAIIRFVIGIALAGIVAGLIGATVVVRGGGLPDSLWLVILRVWSIGDAGGMVVLTPLIVCWWNSFAAPASRKGWIPYTVLACFMLTQIIIDPRYDWPLWGMAAAPIIALCLRLRKAMWTTAGIGISVLIWQTIKGHGPFAQADENLALLHLQYNFPIFIVLLFADAAWLRSSIPTPRSSLDDFMSLYHNSMPPGIIAGSAITLIGIILTATAWVSLKKDEDARFIHAANDTAQVQANFFSNQFEQIREDMDRMSRRTEFLGKQLEAAWRADAKNYHTDYACIQALEWVDAEGYVRWIEPIEGNQSILDKRLNTDDIRSKAMNQARETHAATATSLVKLKQGGYGFLLYSPITLQEQFGGYYLAVMRIETVINYLKNTAPAWNSTNYNTCIVEDGIIVYGTDKKITSNDLISYHGTELDILGKPITVYALPTADMSAVPRHELADLVFNFGLLMSLLFGGCLALAGIAQGNALHAQAAAQAKTQFLAAMSHEIRTPMNGILGSVELAMTKPLDAEVRQNLMTVDQSGRALLVIINDILDFSKIESGKMTIENITFNLKELAVHLESVFSQLAHNKGLTLQLTISPEIPAYVLGDPLRLRQALSNLLSNAIKFTEQGSVHITMTVQGGTAERPIINIQCRDTGIGMNADVLKNLFTPFKQADAAISRRFGGTGLGLAISKDLIELMGGDISCTSTPGSGSTFSINLPYTRVEAPQQVAAPIIHHVAPTASNTKPVSPTTQTHILLAEDNLINQRIATAMLKHLHCDVTLAINGIQAVEQARLKSFDLIFMDMQMPEMDGLEATRRIRAEAGFNQKSIIIALTANAFAEDREACFAAGMTDFIAKPVTINVLKQALETHAQPKVSPG